MPCRCGVVSCASISAMISSMYRDDLFQCTKTIRHVSGHCGGANFLPQRVLCSPPSRRHYLLCLERVAALPCGRARCLLLRLRLATAERRRIMPRHLIGPSRPQRIARISPSKTLQSLIFETNTVSVTPLAASKCSCVFAA